VHPLGTGWEVAQGRFVSIVRRRLDMWQEAPQLQLWSEARDGAAARAAAWGASNHTPAPVEQSYRVVQEGIERHAVNYALDGDLGRAAKALLPQRKAVASASTLEGLQQKHPAAPVPIVPPTRDDHDPPYLFTSEVVQKAISQFDRGSAPGGSGLRPSHLQNVLRASSLHAKAALLSALTAFVNRSFHGHLPELLVPWFVGAPLAAFVKNGGGARPLAVGETLRRLTSKLGVSIVKDRAAMYFGPQDDPYVPVHLGVGVCGGAEIAVHLVRSVVEAHGGDDSFALRTFDFTNAFNEVSRQKILDIAQEKYPELYPYVKMCYAKTSHVWWDGHRMMSAWGVQQGDPLGPLLFCLVIHPVLTEVAKHVVVEFPDLTVEGVFNLFIFYLDTSLPSMRS
jgi:Reverse transcriptase (RNA-dependent DNA polymerase)